MFTAIIQASVRFRWFVIIAVSLDPVGGTYGKACILELTGFNGPNLIQH